MEEWGLFDGDAGLFKLPMLVLEKDDESYEDKGEEEERDGRVGVVLEEATDKKRDVDGSD